jgi:archaellum component FlaF (FlaF/FlaG flagellin family)
MPTVVVTITNAGQVTIKSIDVHPVGVYSVPSNTCTNLSPGHSCTATVQFCPTAPNHYVNSLVVTGVNASTGSTIQASIRLDGTAT